MAKCEDKECLEKYEHSFIYGHSVYWDKDHRPNIWKYCDTRICAAGWGGADRACPKCLEFSTSKGHDPCIKNLPGVEYACCGHGVEEGYVKFDSGKILTGKFYEGEDD